MKYISPVIFVKDIEVSKRFYMELLQQEISDDFGVNIAFKSGLSLWQADSAHSAIYGGYEPMRDRLGAKNLEL
jgi:hypothetical protein